MKPGSVFLALGLVAVAAIVLALLSFVIPEGPGGVYVPASPPWLPILSLWLGSMAFVIVILIRKTRAGGRA